MSKRRISRKRFLSATVAGLAGIKLLPQTMIANQAETILKRQIGKTGLQVSPLCFGATRTNEESLIRYAIDKGINFIDTGRSYANGKNEILVGKAVSGIRNKVVIQSKLMLLERELPSGGKGKKGAEEIRSVLSRKLEESLKALNTDYIDILLFHNATNENLLFHPEVIRFYSGMKSSGVIKTHGFSAHNEYMHFFERNTAEQFYDVIMVPFNYKGSLVHSVTGAYSEWDQDRLISILSDAGNKGIGVIAMKTCSGDKYAPSPDVEPSYREAVRWVLRQPFVSSAAIAMATFSQVDDHIPLLGNV